MAAPISLKAINGAVVSGKRQKLDVDGDYACEVTAIKWAKGFETGGISYVIELVVLESDSPSVRVNQDRSITINRLDSEVQFKRESAFGNLKGFVAAVMADALGEQIDENAERPSPDDTWDSLAEQTHLDEGAGLKGAKFRVKIQNMQTGKQKQHTFAKPTFRAYKAA